MPACRRHPCLACRASASKAWMAGTSPAKTLRKWLDMTGIHSSKNYTVFLVPPGAARRQLLTDTAGLRTAEEGRKQGGFLVCVRLIRVAAGRHGTEPIHRNARRPRRRRQGPDDGPVRSWHHGCGAEKTNRDLPNRMAGPVPRRAKIRGESRAASPRPACGERSPPPDMFGAEVG